MDNAPEFVLVVVCKIFSVKVYCYWTEWDVALFGTVAYMSATLLDIEFSCSGSFILSFTFPLSWWLLM